MAKTTIWISKETKRKLDRLKVHPRETYEEVINRIVQQLAKMIKNELATEGS